MVERLSRMWESGVESRPRQGRVVKTGRDISTAKHLSTDMNGTGVFPCTGFQTLHLY